MRFSIFIAIGWLMIGVAGFSPAPALSNPTGSSVISGSARFSAPDSRTLQIENANGAIIHWKGFSISSNEITRFVQSSSESAVLNRVTGGSASEIFGSLISNGKVFLINPGGIVFGPDAVVDTAGFVASTLEMTDEDFLAGRLKFEAGDTAGDIVNRGYISAGKNGDVMLIAPNIENSGIIRTDGGRLLLAAGRSITIASMDLAGVTFDVQAPENKVLNLGKLLAEKGAIGVFAGTLVHKGEIRADSMTVNESGAIVLSASSDATVFEGAVVSAGGKNGGEITIESGGTTWVESDISARGEYGTGGKVHVLGEKVALAGAAAVDVSGETGGGEVLIGGDYKGLGTVKNAEKTYVGPDAEIHVDAITKGDGGKVIVWADDSSQFYGGIYACGGAESGDGGFAEISGKHFLDYSGQVDLSAANGKAGTVLFDPDYIIVTAAGANGNNGGTIAFADGAGTWEVSAADLDAVNGDVSLEANFDITFNDAINFATAGANLNAKAYRHIYVNSGITLSNGNLYLSADWDSNGEGQVYLNAALNVGTGSIDATGGFGIVEFGSNQIITANSFSADKIIVGSHEATFNADVTTDDLGLDGGVIQGSGDVTVSSAGTFDFRAGTVTGGGAFTTYGETKLGESGSTKLDGRTWTIEDGAKVSWEGNDFTLDGGAVVLNKGHDTDPSPNNTDEGFHRTMGSGNIINGGSGGGTFDNQGDFHNVSGSLLNVGVPFESATGRIVVGNDINFQNAFTLNSGTLEIGSGSVAYFSGGADIDGGNIEGGTLEVKSNTDFNTSTTIDSKLTLNNATINIAGSQTLTVNNEFTMDGASPKLEGPGTVITNGVFNLKLGNIGGATALASLITKGSTDIGGTSDVSISTSLWGNYGTAVWTGNNLTLPGSGTFFNQSSGSFEVNSTGTYTDTSSLTITNNGDLKKVSNGLLLLNAKLSNASTGHIYINNGTLQLDNSASSSNAGTIDIAGGATLSFTGGSVYTNDGVINATGNNSNPSVFSSTALTNKGTIRPGGSPGKFNISGDFSQESSGILEIELGGTSAGTTYDVLAVTGNVYLGGTLKLLLYGSYTPTIGQVFEIITATGTINNSYSFATITPPSGYTATGAIDGSSIYQAEITGFSSSTETETEELAEVVTQEPEPEVVVEPEPVIVEEPEPEPELEPLKETPAVSSEVIAEQVVETSQSTSADVVTLAAESETAASDPESVQPAAPDAGANDTQGEEGEEEEKKKGQVVCRCK